MNNSLKKQIASVALSMAIAGSSAAAMSAPVYAEDYYIRTDFSEDEFSNFLKAIKKRSIKKFNMDVNKKDKILTLSTCSMTGKERVVLHAKRI